ncbi:MAG: HsdM family class I SAM-dependent methyltransferase [Promethearchaeota archaeon]
MLKTHFWKEKEGFIKDFKKEIENTVNLFSNKIFPENKYYKKWIKDFTSIYGINNLNPQLYFSQTLIYFIGLSLVLEKINFSENFIKKHESHYQIFEDIELIKEMLNKYYPDFNLFDIDYFYGIIKNFNRKECNYFLNLIEKWKKKVLELQLNKEYILDFLIQNLISPFLRHKKGEFYTPPFLVKKMVNETYNFGDYVLDPCCGTGNFLIQILKNIINSEKHTDEKIDVINRLYGIDINKLSLFITKINYIIVLGSLASKIKPNIFCCDTLFEAEQKLTQTFDLIIGNPPWYTYRDIDDADYQNRIKELAEKLEIKPLPKNVLNIEISALFFYLMRQKFMKKNSKIFFVLTKGIITGSHASRFRSFRGFKNIKIWLFENKIEKIFNIEFICLYAEKSEDNAYFNLPIPAIKYSTNNGKETISYFENINLIPLKKTLLIPYDIEKKNNKIFVKKLIDSTDYEFLVAQRESPYKNLFKKGADLNPRNLIFVNVKKLDDKLVEISPDPRIFKKAKAPWDKKIFEKEIVEKEFIFNVIKSTELIKFFVYSYYLVFLPLRKSDLQFNLTNLPPNAKKYYLKINDYYIKHKKSSTKNKSLIENLNRWNKLINKRQLSKLKVVYNNSGSEINAAVVQGDFIITGDLSYYSTNNIDEAYYLAAVLNSNIINSQIKIKRSSRHIFKIPFETNIKKFDPNNINHKKLAKLGKIAEDNVKAVLKKIPAESLNKFSKFKIQEMIIDEIKDILIEIDDILKKDLITN